jgi:hypothetical protein
MQGKNAPLRRSDLYWPPVAAVAGLAALATNRSRWKLLNWLLVFLALTCSLLPIPLLEELRGIGGISAITGRLIMTGSSLAIVMLALWLRIFSPKLRGVFLIVPSGLGLVFTSVAFARAEPIVERLYHTLIDPGLAFNLTRAGLLGLVLAGILHLAPMPDQGDTGIR